MKKSNLINKLDNKYSSLKTTDVEKNHQYFF